MQREESRSIEDSPLLNTDSDSPLRSTVHPDRLDISRFSEMTEEEQNPVRIIVYVVIVIIIGVVAALGVKQLISNNSNSDTEEEVVAEVDNSKVKVSVTKLSDNSVSDVVANDDYLVADQITLGESSVATGSLGMFEYQAYTTFVRTTLGFTDAQTLGIAGPIRVEYNSTGNTLEIVLPAGVVVDSEITETISIGDVLSSVEYIAESNSLVFQMRESFLYSVRIDEGNLVFDFKTRAQLDRESIIPEVVETPTTETEETPAVETPTNTNPGTVNYTNEFSQEKQSVVSNVSTNSINLKTQFFEDTGPFFEIAWGEIGKVGDSAIPNATAELKTEGAVNYIEVKIQNVSASSVPSLANSSNIVGIDLSGANFVSSRFVGLENGVATIRVDLKYKSNFKLISVKTVDGGTQVLALQIRD